MPIQQIAYDIPSDLALGIVKGTYKRFGGVVRDSSTGAIVKHLKEAEIPKKGGRAILKVIKRHPIAAIGIGATVTIGSAATSYVVKKKKEKRDKSNTPECVLNFEKSLKKYLKAVRKGTLDERTIDKLMDDLNQIGESDGGEQISLDFSTKELGSLVNMIYDYTRKLAKANSVKLKRYKLKKSNSIINLYDCLEMQKKIFEEVA